MKKSLIALFSILAFITFTAEDCSNSAVSTSGISKVSTSVQTDLNGNTIEQNNIIERLKADNKPGSIKHLYVISAMSGQVILYSTVKGKVTSSGKRLSPSTATGTSSGGWFKINLDALNYFYTNEILGDDGTYGSSSEYIFWWDSKGVYHQHYPSGGQIIHISNEPLAVKSIILNLETNTETK